MTQPKPRLHSEEEEALTLGAAHAEVLRLAREQKVRPIASIDDLRCSFWPTEETEGVEEFDTWLRAIRQEKSRQGIPE